MKKLTLFLFMMLVTTLGYAQTTSTPPTDFFAGKWEISVAGTPMGDVKLVTDLVRKNSVLTGELSDPADTTKQKRPITKVEEKGDKLIIYFESSQAGELAIDLNKVDENMLKGTVYNFEAIAKRIK
ncbi:hypothetical protein [Arsenicibacter rosenii]|uniref:DUF4488 domain-containing protein n=1 Tax=Arsenicibacter rosenii TaxID=1750698 RepID=A0A1S2VFA1_9BACT|nr:hypothetical protein [Arsenicibacter rosenii]OIN57437.1 hypothetical protein BLX24_19600 [Arsenicibacter rosenii]